MRLFVPKKNFFWGGWFGIIWCTYVKFIQYNQMNHIFLGRRIYSWSVPEGFDNIDRQILRYCFTWVLPEGNIVLLFDSGSYFTDEYFRWIDEYCTYKTCDQQTTNKYNKLLKINDYLYFWYLKYLLQIIWDYAGLLHVRGVTTID